VREWTDSFIYRNDRDVSLFWFTATLLFVLWVLLSGRLDAFHLTLGVVSSMVVAFISYDLLFQDQERGISHRMRPMLRFPRYAVWLCGQIVRANLYVLYLTLHPGVKKTLDPRIVRFKTVLKSDFARFIFATSITLTPGTVTVRVFEDEFIVHAITRKMAESLPGDMERRIVKIFEEKDGPGP
jgi:multicomponent Na+:H+ antiporter subunit E